MTLRLNQDGRRLLYAEASGKSELYNIETGASIATYDFGNPTYTARFTPDDELLIFAAKDPIVINSSTGDTLLRLPSLGRTYDAAYSPDGRYIATLSIDYGVRLWDAATGSLISLLGKQESIGYSLEFSRSGEYILTSLALGSAYIWRVPKPPSAVEPHAHEYSMPSSAYLVPNPASRNVVVRYMLTSPANVRLRMFDIKGALVMELPGVFQEPGEHHSYLNVRDLTSGFYFCEILVDEKRIVRVLHVEH